MSQQNEAPLYQAFLLRCWPLSTDATDGPTAWRFELQEVAAESCKHRFSDLEQVCVFVAAKLTAIATDNDSIANSGRSQNLSISQPGGKNDEEFE